MYVCVWNGQLGTGGRQIEPTGPSLQVFVTAGVRHLLHVSRETSKGKKGKQTGQWGDDWIGITRFASGCVLLLKNAGHNIGPVKSCCSWICMTCDILSLKIQITICCKLLVWFTSCLCNSFRLWLLIKFQSSIQGRTSPSSIYYSSNKTWKVMRQAYIINRW